MGVAAPASSSIDRHSLPTVHGKYDRRRWAMRVCFASLASHASVCGAPHLLQYMFTTVSSQPNHHRGWVVTMELKFRRKPIKPVGSVLSVYRKPDRSNLKFSKNYFFEIKIPNKLESILKFLVKTEFKKSK
jgi:hypothetical protein